MGIFKSLDNLDKEKPEVKTSVRFSTIEYNYDTVLKCIENGTYSNAKIQILITNNYQIYLNYDNFTNVSTRKTFQALWTNATFLRNFVYVLTQTTDSAKILATIKSRYRITINRITYDYYSASSAEEKNSEVCDLLLKLCELVDFEYIRPLTNIVDPTTAKFMTMAVFSSNDIERCVDRLNDLIIKTGFDFSINDIVEIYGRFYSNSFSLLWNYTMTSVYDNLKPNELHNNDRINLALVNILNNMTSEDIYKILYQYSCYVTMMQKAKIRFSVRGLSNDFSRINKVVNVLLDEEVYLP
mgnify:FL=1